MAKTIEEIVTRIQQIQEKEDNKTAIAFKCPTVLFQNTLFQLLHCFFYKDLDRDTIYTKNKRIQCFSGSYRSASDLYRILKNSYPEYKFTLLQVITYLHYMAGKGYIVSDYCTVVRKRVHSSYMRNGHFSNQFYDKYLDEYQVKPLPDHLGLLREDYDLLLDNYPVDKNKELELKEKLAIAV